jgi:hypothetical protein
MQTSHSFNRQSCTLGLLLVCTFSASPSQAQSLRDFHQNSAGNCHAANSVAETYMDRAESGYLNTNTNNRRRSQDVLVICNPVTDSISLPQPSNKPKQTVAELQFFAHNTLTTRDATLTCTLTAGYLDSPDIIIETQSAVLPTNGDLRTLLWNDHGNYTNFYPAPLSVVCNVPAGVELTDNVVLYLLP